MAILSSDKTFVTVQKGDTLSEIARDYKTESGNKTYQQLAALNNIDKADLIYIDQKIYLTKSSGSSSGGLLDDLMVTIKQFGLQAYPVENKLFVTWTWTKSNTDHYEVRWEYYTEDKTWFVGHDGTTTYKYSTYEIPNEATQVRVRIRPISKKKKVDNRETSYWTAIWSTWKKHKVVEVPPVPSAPTVTAEGLKLTAELSKITEDPSIIQFRVVADNATTWKTGKVAVTEGYASYTCNINAGSVYKVQARAYKNGQYSEWSDYSANIDTVPATPSKFTKCEPKTEKSILLEWAAVPNADSYKIEYATSKSHFEGSDQVQSKDGITTTSYEMSSGIETGVEYFFRLCAVNEKGSSGWSEISSTIIGGLPYAPTTWSSTTTAIVGEPLNLYWVHNSRDGSSESFAHLEVKVDNTVVVDEHIENKAKEEDKDKTKSYSISTSGYPEGAKLKWRVRTAGISKVYGDWSIERTADIYAPPVVTLSLMDASGKSVDTVKSLPIKVSASTLPKTQRPIGYHLSIVSNDIYETVDNVGNTKVVNAGEQIYSRHFDISEPLSTTLSAGDLTLENNISYTMTCTASMDSGLTGEDSIDFEVEWTPVTYTPNAELGYDEDTFSMYIRPYCSTGVSTYHKVQRQGNSYVVTDDTFDSAYGQEVSKMVTTTGEQVYYGTTDEGEQTYYCMVNNTTMITDVILSVYRREYDGTFTELAADLDGAKRTTIVDPHPALDYARYRVVALSKTTGTATYYDLPGYPINGKSVIIQWDEEWSNFDTFGNEDALEQPAWSGSLLQLHYNIDVSNKNSSDVSLIEYIGRKHPVTYYGTHVGESATWSMTIDKNDIETLYALRRLAVWMGDVYVREPSGSGYWANIKVSFSQKHCEVTIPVSIEVTRVEGGI